MIQHRKKRPQSRRARDVGDNEYEVGYRKPPVATQFRPGRSGNPKGRPKGAKNLNTMLHETLMRPVGIRDGDKIKKVPAVMAIMLKHLERSLKGDTKSKEFLLRFYDEPAIHRQQEARRLERGTGDRTETPAQLYDRLINQVVG